MDKISLEELADRHLALAREAHAGRSAETVYGGHDHMLRQTMVALTEGTELAEHENPGEATLQVLSGRVRLGAGDDEWEATAGELVEIPPSRHNLQALEDSVVVLTVAKQL